MAYTWSMAGARSVTDVSAEVRHDPTDAYHPYTSSSQITGPAGRHLGVIVGVLVLMLVIAGPGAASGAVSGAASAAGKASTFSAGSHRADNLRVGSVDLSRCGARKGIYCGTLRVPLEWASPTGPKIQVCFRWYPATDPAGPPAGTVMPVEGGPGYPSILSVAPDGYRSMYGPLLRRFNMLAIDLRGTGCSTVLDCPALQDYRGPSGSTALAAVVGTCAHMLNHRWRDPAGGYVHASDSFTSAPAAEDVAAVVTALGLRSVDVYGDSYGSWFAQVFAARYPKLVRSLTLDSTYQVLGLDPWYRSSIEVMPLDFDTACAGSTACAAAGGASWPRIEALAARLRAAPVSGDVPGPDGSPEHVTMGIEGLVNLVSDAAEDTYLYRGMDAAARALLEDDDPAPLLRLYAQRRAFDEIYFGTPVSEYSVELYMAVSCLDYPQLFDLSSSKAARLDELAAKVKSLPASTFAPFTTAEWLAMDQNTENLTACLDWPAPTAAEPPVSTSPPLLPADMPVLILGGQLDTWTPPAGVAEVEDEIGGKSRFVVMKGSTHVVAEGDVYGCATSILRQFVAVPSALRGLNTSCAAKVPTVRAVGSYPDRLGEVPPLRLESANRRATPTTELELAAAAVMTAGDAVARYLAIGVVRDTGLHGGSAVAGEGGSRLVLENDELVPGVEVTGHVFMTATKVRAILRAVAGGVPEETLVASWATYGGRAVAQVSAIAGKTAISGRMPAP